MLVQKWGFPELSISSRGFGGKGGVDWLNCRGVLENLISDR